MRASPHQPPLQDGSTFAYFDEWFAERPGAALVPIQEPLCAIALVSHLPLFGGEYFNNTDPQ